jgi:pSer/pThr/pTyr-binding forkhead associated (FHA) protein
VSEHGASLEDCGSRNGTFLGGDRVTEAVPLRDWDRILLGSALLVFRCFARDKVSTAAEAAVAPTGPLGVEEPGPPHSHV